MNKLHKRIFIDGKLAGIHLVTLCQLSRISPIEKTVVSKKKVTCKHCLKLMNGKNE